MKIIPFYVLSTDKKRDLSIFSKLFNKEVLFTKPDHYSIEIESVICNIQILELSIHDHLEVFNDLFLDIFEESRGEATRISEEPVEGYVKNQHVSSVFGSVLNILAYQEENFSLMDLATTLFYKLLIRHLLRNGNKRVATVFLKLFLQQFNLNFQWKIDFYQNYKNHEEIIGLFVEKLQNSKNSKNNDNFKKVYNEIKKWIIDNTIIDRIIDFEKGVKYE